MITTKNIILKTEKLIILRSYNLQRFTISESGTGMDEDLSDDKKRKEESLWE